MDRDYIKLCAEMAYNEVIIEAVLNEEVLQEDTSSIKEKGKLLLSKFKEFINKIKTFIIKLFNNISNFMMEKARQLKAKIEELTNDSKHESVSLYDQLMEMVLNEGDHFDYNKILDDVKKLFDQIMNNLNEVINAKTHFRNVTLESIEDLVKRDDFNDEDLSYLQRCITKDKEAFDDMYEDNFKKYKMKLEKFWTDEKGYHETNYNAGKINVEEKMGKSFNSNRTSKNIYPLKQAYDQMILMYQKTDIEIKDLIEELNYDVSHYASSLNKYLKEEQKYYLAFANYASSMKDMSSKTMYLAKDTLQALTKLSVYLYKIPIGFFDSLKK